MNKRKTIILFPLLLVLLVVLAVGCGQQKENKQKSQPKTAEKAAPKHDAGLIVAMGDSLTAGLGLPETLAYPAQLAAKLKAAGYNYQVINAGISGETSRGALERTSWILSFQPDIVILETGANDGLRGLDPKMTEQNIDKIIAAFQAKKVVVVLCGMQMVRNLGEQYTKEFAAIYPEVAKKRQVIFMPFFLKDVGGEPKLNQPDGIHPIPAGYRIVVNNLLPYVKQAIQESEKTKKGTIPSPDTD